MLDSSGSGGLPWSGAGRAAPGKGAWKVEVGISRGASQPDVASGGVGQPALQKLVEEIIQLGYMPTQSKNASVEEKRLARRLIKAREAGSLTREQESALANLAQVKAQELLQLVRDLGRYPMGKAAGSIAERQLAEKVRRAGKAKQFSPEQEAELEALAQVEADNSRGAPQPAVASGDAALLALEDGIVGKT